MIKFAPGYNFGNMFDWLLVRQGGPNEIIFNSNNLHILTVVIGQGSKLFVPYLCYDGIIFIHIFYAYPRPTNAN